jgi:Zn-dependent alcohol dehydrogenase
MSPAGVKESTPEIRRRTSARALAIAPSEDGILYPLDPATTDVVREAFALTGVGVDNAFDAVGRAHLVQAGLAATRNGGTTVAVGEAPLDDVITIAPAALFTISEKKLVGCTLGSCHAVRDIPRLIALWQAGRLDLEALVTARRPIAEINQAMDDLRASRGIRTILSLA